MESQSFNDQSFLVSAIHQFEYQVNLTEILSQESRRRKELKHFIKFAIVGILGTVTDFTILILLIELVGFIPVVANGFSFSVSILQNFILNRQWTFPESRIRTLRQQLTIFVIVSVIGLGINTIIFYFVDLSLQPYWSAWLSNVDWGDRISYIFAKLCAISIVLFWNFTANRLWTFKEL